jgi:hypothetical protein
MGIWDAEAHTVHLCILVFSEPNQTSWIMVLLPAAFHIHYKSSHLKDNHTDIRKEYLRNLD